MSSGWFNYYGYVCVCVYRPHKEERGPGRQDQFTFWDLHIQSQRFWLSNLLHVIYILYTMYIHRLYLPNPKTSFSSPFIIRLLCERPKVKFEKKYNSCRPLSSLNVDNTRDCKSTWHYEFINYKSLKMKNKNHIFLIRINKSLLSLSQYLIIFK